MLKPKLIASAIITVALVGGGIAVARNDTPQPQNQEERMIIEPTSTEVDEVVEETTPQAPVTPTPEPPAPQNEPEPAPEPVQCPADVLEAVNKSRQTLNGLSVWVDHYRNSLVKIAEDNNQEPDMQAIEKSVNSRYPEYVGLKNYIATQEAKYNC